MANSTSAFPTANKWVTVDERDYVVIENLETFEPFFLNLVSPNEQWLFCSSNGALAAGRNSPESSLFPYYTVDKITDNWNTTGPHTAIVCNDLYWTPFQPLPPIGADISRRLLKSPQGDEIMFDEIHHGLKIRMAYSWQLSDEFGLIRKAKLTNTGKQARELRMIDGLDNFLPPGVSNQMQNMYSCLADAYKVSELECDGSLLVHRLASGIVDAPIPLESLYATTVWTHGLGSGCTYMSRTDAESFLRDQTPPAGDRVRATRGAFFLGRNLSIGLGESVEWLLVVDNNQTQGDVALLCEQLSAPEQLTSLVERDLEKGRNKLRDIVACCDGFQETEDRDASLYHYQNTLCNILRGGVPEKGYTVSKKRFIEYLVVQNAPLAKSKLSFLNSLPESLERSAFLAAIDEAGDVDLKRIATEYLPLVLSRRHGDPSRPWNRFDIRLKDENGDPIHRFEGNWRDIFQNWEALALSYPGYLDAFITKFLNASTADGYNPYRVTSDGIDWEIPEEDNPWGSIGYWGDHQIIYLLKLLELQVQVNPALIEERLNEVEYVYADVPYRFRLWQEILANPRESLEFDHGKHEWLQDRKSELGADGLLLHRADGEIARATLCEKLLLPAVIKIGNLVPGGGIWLNGQKPEWNDANNALAGYGLSVVTVGYLYRYFGFLDRVFSSCKEENFYLSPEFVELVEQLFDLLSDENWLCADNLDGSIRYTLVKQAGEAVEGHQRKVYEAGPSAPVSIERKQIVNFVKLACKVLHNTLARNQRSDRLWHAYNILDCQDNRLEIRHLDLMLEGQVSILSSGFLDSVEATELLDALFASELRSDRHPTFLLYPDKQLPRFLEANQISKPDISQIASLQSLLEKGDESIVYSDCDGQFRFHPSLVNEAKLRLVLTKIDIADRKAIEKIYESVFQHQSFTGRSGSMFGYEGLGCVYWHMVSKLMLAVQEVVQAAVSSGADEALVHRLKSHYLAVQSGLGYRQSAEQFGAFPSDPYSHSPGTGGAKQPGLTGQVKEGILCRFGELGVEYHNGGLRFRPHLLHSYEFSSKDQLKFSFCQIPIIYQRCKDSDNLGVEVFFVDSTSQKFPSGTIDESIANEITSRSGRITNILVNIPVDLLI